MKDLLRRAFVDNAAIKAVALLLAITLFIAVRGDRDASISFNLPVAYTEPADRVMTGRPVDSIRVTVTGSWARLKRFDGRSMEPLRVDLSRLSDGDYVFAADMIQLPAGLHIAAINPPSIRLQFEERATKVVPVRATLSGNLAKGFRVESTEVSPQNVTVRGARSVIEALTEVRTVALPLDGKSANFDARVAIAPSEAHVTVDDISDVEVKISVTEELEMVGLGPLPVKVLAVAGAPPPKPGTHTAPAGVRLILRGPKNALDAIDRGKVSVHVTWHAEDARVSHPRPALVLVEGLPAGVAIEVEPREVTLLPKQ